MASKEDIKKAREAAKKKGNKTFTVDGLRYDTATGRRKPLSAAPLLEATQKRIDYERKARDKKQRRSLDADLIGKEVSRYSADTRKPQREKKASKTRRGARKKLKSERYTEHDTIGPSRKTRGYVVEPARFVEGKEPGSVDIERKVYTRKKGKDGAKKVKFNLGGLASAAKTITSGTTRSRNKTKPRGVGVATRGYGKALK